MGLLTICPTYFNTKCLKDNTGRSVVVSDVCFGRLICSCILRAIPTQHGLYGTPARQMLYVERVYHKECFAKRVCLECLRRILYLFAGRNRDEQAGSALEGIQCIAVK